MILGHQEIRNYLSRIIQEDRIPHALLMVGPEGSGQLELAILWCKMLFCQNPNNGFPCQACKSCQKIEEHVHPDIHFAFPVVKHDNFKREETTSKHFLTEWRGFLKENIHGSISDWLKYIGGSNKTGNINVAECNQIIHNLGLMSYEGKYKIQIIWHAESLAKEGNRLLKLIEEPADNTIIILIANNLDAILNTIQSRCQLLRIPSFTTEEITDYLESKYNLSKQKLRELSYLSEGSIRKADELINSSEINFSEEMIDWFRKAYKADPDELVAWVNHLNTIDKDVLKNFFRYCLHFLREYLVAMTNKSTENLRLSEEEKAVIFKMQKILSRENANDLHNLFNKNVVYIDRNLSLKIMLMDMSLKINEILRSEVNKFV